MLRHLPRLVIEHRHLKTVAVSPVPLATKQSAAPDPAPPYSQGKRLSVTGRHANGK
jgi:hypothetical protein